MIWIGLCIHLFKLLWKIGSSYHFDGLHLSISWNLNGMLDSSDWPSNKKANLALQT